MKYLKIVFVWPILFLSMQGCVYFNEDGISTHRYRDCVEYYDAEGVYHCECDENIVDYSELPDKLLK